MSKLKLYEIDAMANKIISILNEKHNPSKKYIKSELDSLYIYVKELKNIDEEARRLEKLIASLKGRSLEIFKSTGISIRAKITDEHLKSIIERKIREKNIPSRDKVKEDIILASDGSLKDIMEEVLSTYKQPNER